MAKKDKERLSQAEYQKRIDSYSDEELTWFFSFTRATLTCPAFRALSGTALKVFMAMWANTYMSGGDKDKRNTGRDRTIKGKYGEFMAPFNYLKCYGITNNRTLQKAIKELVDLKFIVVVQAPTKTKPAKYRHSASHKNLSQSKVEDILKKQRCIKCTK